MINKAWILIILLFFVTGGFFTTVKAQECTYTVFADEFNYDGAPASLSWNFETGAGGWGNNELQNYTNSRENSYVSNGTLKIHAKKSSTGVWTSARMVTAGKASWKYGRFEIRAKLPSGRGTWPAIWMMPQNSTYGGWPNSGEIDIMEHVGYEPGKVHGTIHTEAYNHKIGTQRGGSVLVDEVHTQFHIYSIEWTPDKITWFVDDEEYYSFRNPNLSYKEWPFDQPFFLILNIAIGGDWGGAMGIDPALSEAVMEIDYVRVYQTLLPDFEVVGPNNVEMNQELEFSVTHIDGLNYTWTLPAGAQIIGESNSNSIRVKWGNTAGNVQCVVASACEQKTANPLNVTMQLKPQNFPFILPSLNAQNQTNWSVPKQQDGNAFSLSADGKQTRVDYTVNEPLSNPYIAYVLPYTADFADAPSVAVNIKTFSNNAPDILRVDFVDQNGKVNTSDLFKIDDVLAYNHFHRYSYVFSGSTSTWKMDRIVELRLYVNFGYFGKPGDGTFVIGDIELAPDGFFEQSISPAQSPWCLPLNMHWSVAAPFEQVLTLESNEQQVNIQTAQGLVPDSNYVEYVFAQPVDLYLNSELSIQFASGGTYPQSVRVALIDQGGNYNPGDVFVIDDFSGIDEGGEFCYVFGNKPDGGDFMLCRVQSVRMWVNNSGTQSQTSNFSINKICLNSSQGMVNVAAHQSLDGTKVYPNPASNLFVIEANNWENTSFKMYNAVGNIVLKGKLHAKTCNVDIRFLPAGVYNILFEKNDQLKHRHKMIIIE
jgi:beta-glucanase (GH16 family)